MFLHNTTNRLRLSCSRQQLLLSVLRHKSIIPLLSNDLYNTRLEISAKRKPNHILRQDASSILPFLGSRVKRDAVLKLNPWVLTSLEDSIFKLKAQPILTYIDDLELNFNELLCVAHGLTDMELKINDNNYQTRILRKLGYGKFKVCLLRNTIFLNDRYLTASQVEIEEDLSTFENTEIVYEFLKWNQLHQFSLINRELLINEKLSSEEFKLKRIDLWKKTSLGSFYTMLGILLIKYNEKSVNEFITNKVITGKRGIIDIVKLKQL
ncbi:MAG: hypothetical protein M5F18_12855 [Asgard group archaeon]|nr:hypothetical protein [Asgard group archaeon]